ncbi:MAG: hypothetical protein Q7K40_01170 [bacterium]|nr:hypothetical protein [bacterium]
MNETNETSKEDKVMKIVVGLLVIATVAALFFYSQTRSLQQNPNKVNEEKIAALVNKVEKIIALPKGESPAMATVTDLAPLAGNPFFARAKIGDEVLLYTAAKKAFLYDPKANIILEVASLNIGNK